MINIGEEFLEGAKIYSVREIIFSPSSQYPYSVVDGEFIREIGMEELAAVKDLMISLGPELGHKLAYLREQIRRIRDWRRLESLGHGTGDGKTPWPQRIEREIDRTQVSLESSEELPDKIRVVLWTEFHKAIAPLDDGVPF